MSTAMMVQLGSTQDNADHEAIELDMLCKHRELAPDKTFTDRIVSGILDLRFMQAMARIITSV
jgi:hypothetical protein